MALTLASTKEFSAAGSENQFQMYISTGDPSGATFNIIPPVRVTDDGVPYLRSESTLSNPFSFDPNHYFPGIGYVNLLNIGYCAPFNDPNSAYPANTKIGGGKAVLQCRVRDFRMPTNAKLHWWFQNTPGGPLYYNYAQTENPISDKLGFGSAGARRAAVDAVDDSGWQTVEIPFPASDAAWSCMGSNPTRTGVAPATEPPAASTIYGCAKSGVAEALALNVVDMGVLAVWENTASGSGTPSERITGKFELRQIDLYLDI